MVQQNQQISKPGHRSHSSDPEKRSTHSTQGTQPNENREVTWLGSPRKSGCALHCCPPYTQHGVLRVTAASRAFRRLFKKMRKTPSEKGFLNSNFLGSLWALACFTNFYLHRARGGCRLNVYCMRAAPCLPAKAAARPSTISLILAAAAWLSRLNLSRSSERMVAATAAAATVPGRKSATSASLLCRQQATPAAR
jgi:hypothetical protein